MLGRVGLDKAAAPSVVVGDNPERPKSKAAFAHLRGTVPIPASSGKVVKHRLNSYGKRKTLYILALNRMRHDPRTWAYVERHTNEGKTKGRSTGRW